MYKFTVGHLQALVVTGYIGLKNTVLEDTKVEALPNLRTVRHSSKLEQGSRRHRLSSNGST